MKNYSLLFIVFLFFQFTSLSQEGWFEQTSGTTEVLNSVYFIDNHNGFIVGDNGTFLKTTDVGENWTSHPTGTNETIKSVQFLNQNTGFAVAKLGDSAWVMKTTDGGENWVTQTLNPTYPILDLRTIQFTDANTGWTAGQRGDDHSPRGVLYKTTDGGSAWIEKIIPIPAEYWDLRSFHFIDSDNGWVVGWGALDTSNSYTPILPIFKTTDGGDSWINHSIQNIDGGLNSVYFVNESIGWVVGFLPVGAAPQNCIFKTTDGGSNWIEQDPPHYPFGGHNSIFFIDENTGWTVGGIPYVSFKGILYTTNGGADWIEQGQDTMIELTDVFFVDENNGWTVGHNGKILHTTNGGVSFVEEEAIGEIPTEYSLTQNFPNPFNPTTKIKYQIPELSFVTLKVYDVLGNEIETLVNKEKPTGTYEITWYAENLPSGIYFYQLKAGTYIETKKMILLK